MRLEKIVLNGFKSFADKTEFNFDSPITAIVGPNGCGKSNVVDAVKWVLGEQSVKSLRSGQMADVIFGGSSSRKPLGTAEVSLFISDTLGKLPIEAEQVQITRRIYKSGESEYSINNKICRLKDIRELFMDTGIGTKAYSIIEQGQIEQLLSVSKIDRRAIFEEAAGISKYKAHKKEAARKLERTDQNLLRLADILGEVQKQLRSIKLQAGKARNYLQYTQRLKELQVNYSLVEYHKIITTSEEKRHRLNKIEEQFAEIAAETAKNESLASDLGNEVIETENQINLADNNLVSVQSKIEQQLQKIEFLRSRITELQQRKYDAHQRTENLQKQQNLLEYELKQKRQEKTDCENILEDKHQTLEELQQNIQKINVSCTTLEAELEDEKSGIIDMVRKTTQLHNEMQNLCVYRSNLSNQKDRLASRISTTRQELEKLLTEKAQQKARYSDIESVLTDLQKNLDFKSREIEQINKQIDADNERLANIKETRSALSSELAVLTDMESRREELNSAVKSILVSVAAKDGNFDYVEGLLADIVGSDIKYANAVEAALEGKAESLVINNTNKLMANEEKTKKFNNRVNFICADKITPFSDQVDLSNISGIIGRLVEFVNYEGRYARLVWELLGKIVVVESIESAIELSDRLGDKYKFVTLNGEMLTADNVIKVGPLGKSTGLISRKSRLRQLQKILDNTIAEIVTIEKHIENNKQSKLHIDKLCKDLRTAI
ncbi:MAG: chromosome segregation protein SMC, partial [Planctomycetota bacterium]